MKRGYTQNTPNLPVIRELTDNQARLVSSMNQPGTKVYKMGKVHILVSPPFKDLGWHLSISRPDRLPSWDEVAKARYELLPPNIIVVMVLPPEDDYVNLHEYCFQLHELINARASGYEGRKVEAGD